MATPLRLIHPELSTFGSAVRPLRPSKIGKLLGCAMSVVLTMHDEREGGAKAQTGNLVHSAAMWYHKTEGTEAARIEAGLAALEEARGKFPEGDEAKARSIFASYAADKANRDAKVLWCEEPVRLTLKADPTDPTQEEIVIQGTLDQVREDKDGDLYVHDIKTGDYNDEQASILEYLAQQATYILAARETLSKKVVGGGLIYTPGYAKVRGRVHLPLPLTVGQCEDILRLVPAIVAAVRRGEAVFRPGKEACQWCEKKPWPKCHNLFKGMYG